MNEEPLQKAIALAKAGKKDEALPLLHEILMDDPQNELGWLWLTDCLPTLTGRIAALETFVNMVPDAKRARAGLEALRRQAAAQRDTAAARPEAAAQPGVPGPLEPPTQPGAPGAGSLPFSSPSGWVYEPEPAGQESSPGAVSLETGNIDLPARSEPGLEGAPEHSAGQPMPAGDSGPLSPFLSEVEPGEWPELKKRMQSDPGLREAARKAGLTIDFSDSTLDDAPAPGTDFPAAPLQEPGPPVSAFTVPIEDGSPAEFEQIQQRSQAALENRPAIRPLKNQPRPTGSARPVPPKTTPPKNKQGPSLLNILLVGVFILGILGILALLAGLILTRGLF